MFLAPFESRLEPPAELTAWAAGGRDTTSRNALERWLPDVADALERHEVILVKLGTLRLGGPESYELAQLVVRELRAELVRRGAPPQLDVEFDPVDDTAVEDGERTRDRLPHNDGQHGTYLTPSVLDAPEFDPRLRVFSRAGGHSSSSHKPYSGIFIEEPGDGLSVTTFYDAFGLVRHAYRHQFGAEPTVAATAGWLGTSVAAAVARQHQHGSAYPSLAGLLGAGDDPAWEVLDYCTSEARIPADLRSRYPALDRMRVRCPCERCQGETERIYCAMMQAALGIGWTTFREQHEMWMSSERFDLLFWNNLARLHGAVKGSCRRLLRPMYLSLPAATGEEYESWLSRLWHARLPVEAPRVVVPG